AVAAAGDERQRVEVWGAHGAGDGVEAGILGRQAGQAGNEAEAEDEQTSGKSRVTAGGGAAGQGSGGVHGGTLGLNRLHPAEGAADGPGLSGRLNTEGSGILTSAKGGATGNEQPAPARLHVSRLP